MRDGRGSDARLTRPVVNRLRSLCLSFPETTERSSWGHPNFRAGKRTFATFEIVGGRPSIAFRLPSVNVDLLLRRKQFFVTPYGAASGSVYGPMEPWIGGSSQNFFSAATERLLSNACWMRSISLKFVASPYSKTRSTGTTTTSAGFTLMRSA